MAFVPTQAPAVDGHDAQELAKWMEVELQRLAQLLQEDEGAPMLELHVAPEKPREGQKVFADGTDWDPGSGRGPYMYVNGSWMFTGYVAPPDLTPYMQKANNLSDVADVPTSRSSLGLGTAAVLDVGTAADKIVQLDSSAKLPAVDGSQLTNLPTQTGRLVAGTPLVLNPYATSSSTSQAHGLGAIPVYIDWVFECLSADLNYSAGDQIRDTPGQNTPAVLADATNLYLITPTVVAVFPNKTTFGFAAITAANWKLTLTPYKLTT